MMADQLEIFLLGGITIKLNGEPVVELTSRKALALFIYLVCNRRPLSRDLLADLFYPKLPQTRALADLRVLLSRLRPLKTYLRVTRQSVAFNLKKSYWLDTLALEEQLVAAREQIVTDSILSAEVAAALATALDLYQGDFLAGFHLPDAVDFEEWLIIERERLHRLAIEGLVKLVDYYVNSDQHQLGIEQSVRLLQLDPLQEQAHSQMMTLLARSGQRNAALAQYETCRRLLGQELGVEPSLKTKALYERLLESAGQEPHNLPLPTTSFVGREEELVRINWRLQEPTCRLLSLVGPGGIGKTRLAIEAVAHHTDRFWHGIYFFPLTTVESTEQLILTISKAFNLTFLEAVPPKTQLLEYLQQKELLLVLDSFEHLPDSVELLVAILQAAPKVKILVTSQERLNLASEWALPIQGLSLPPSAALKELVNSSAGQLLLERGRQVRPGFKLSDANRAAVARLCRLVGGMPLAIELAAAWLKMFSCAEIADAISQDFGFLVTSRPDVPERQRSLQAVFEHSWRLLSQAEHRVVRRMAVFQGGFRYPAAMAVIYGQGGFNDKEEADRHIQATLAALVDKSLLQMTTSGRYEQYPLLQKFASGRLATRPVEQKQVQERHGRYYAAFLKDREAGLKRSQQVEVLAEIGEEIDNIRAAWRWNIERRRLEEIGQCLESLFLVYLTRDRYYEGEAAFGQAVAALQPREFTPIDQNTTKILGTALTAHGMCYFHLGRYEQAEDRLKQGLTLLKQVGPLRMTALALTWLGLVALARNEVGLAQMQMQEGLALAQANDDQWSVATILGCLGHWGRSKNYQQAANYYRESVTIFKEIGDQRAMMISLFYLGEMMGQLGNLAEAKSILEECLAFARATPYQNLAIWSLAALAELAYTQGIYADAQQYLQEILGLAKQNNERQIYTPDLVDSEATTEALQNCPATKEYLQETLKLVVKMQALPKVLGPLFRLVELLKKRSVTTETVTFDKMTP